jgi:hypothetical protein
MSPALLTYTSAYEFRRICVLFAALTTTPQKVAFTSDGSPIICTICYPLFEHCILSAGRLHLAKSAFRDCEPYPYSTEAMTSRPVATTDTRRLQWRQPTILTNSV